MSEDGVDQPTATAYLEFALVSADGAERQISRAVADETPIAIELNGIGYAVLMASKNHLEDLAVGFAWSERLIDDMKQILDIDAHDTGSGVMLRITLSADRAQTIHERVRHRSSESSCGMCGIENLEQAMRPLPRLAVSPPVSQAAVFAALGALRDHQPINAVTGAVHAAALCAADGTIRLVREDVGRHNAFDKMIGSMVRDGRDWEGGFALLSSRCSYELVEKAVLAGCPTLVTISAPTSLAVHRAAEAGLQLLALARPDSFLEPCHRV